MTPEQKQEIMNLRDRQLTPKQIARKLGLRPADVKAVIKATAIDLETQRIAEGKLPPVVGCWCDGYSYDDLFNPAPESDEGDITRGLCVVTVARSVRRARCRVASYLIDYQCLGVKDAIPPRSLNENELPGYLNTVYQGFGIVPLLEITLEEAQAIVLGAHQYAKSLGLDPHPDFEKTRKFLGEWDGEPSLEFGCNGTPLYVQGSYDDAPQIIKTLTQTVGEGNFDYILTGGQPLF